MNWMRPRFNKSLTFSNTSMSYFSLLPAHSLGATAFFVSYKTIANSAQDGRWKGVFQPFSLLTCLNSRTHKLRNLKRLRRLTCVTKRSQGRLSDGDLDLVRYGVPTDIVFNWWPRFTLQEFWMLYFFAKGLHSVSCRVDVTYYSLSMIGVISVLQGLRHLRSIVLAWHGCDVIFNLLFPDVKVDTASRAAWTV
jgi:hypothetical protein